MATKNSVNTTLSGQTGTGQFAGDTSPAFTTPDIGVATATSVNKITITAPATGATLTIADGGTLATSGGNSLTLTTTGATNVTLPTSGTLATTSGGGLVVVNVTGTSANLTNNSLTIANNAGLVTLTLPVSSTIGDVIQIKGSGAGGWIIAQNASQIIHVGNVASTAGVGGSVASTNRYDCLSLCCVVTDLEYVVSGMQSSGVTIV